MSKALDNKHSRWAVNKLVFLVEIGIYGGGGFCSIRRQFFWTFCWRLRWLPIGKLVIIALP